MKPKRLSTKKTPRARKGDAGLSLVALLVVLAWLAWSGAEFEMPPAGETTSSRDDVGSTSSSGDGASELAAAEVLERIDAARSDDGLPPLGPDLRLMAAAQSHSNAMAAAGRCAHEGRGLEPLEDRLAAQGLAPDRYGEILACGAADADEALRLWQRSADHRAILFDPGYTEVGVGMEPDGEGGWYWTAVFAAGS